MAETETVAPPAEGAAPEKGGRRKLLLIAAPVVLLGVLAAVWFLVLAPKGDEEGAAPAVEEPLFSAEAGAIVPVDETTVSLGGDEPHFAMVTYSAVLSIDVVDQALVEANLPRLRSEAQLVFRSYEAAVLDTPDGLRSLTADLTAVAHDLWPDGEVQEILVESLLVQ